MKWMLFRCWHCGDFTLLKVLSLFIVCCTVKIKTGRKTTLPIALPMFLWQEPRALCHGHNWSPCKKTTRAGTFPHYWPQPGSLQVGLGLRGGHSQGSPGRFDEDKHSPTKRGGNWFRTIVALSCVFFKMLIVRAQPQILLHNDRIWPRDKLFVPGFPSNSFAQTNLRIPTSWSGYKEQWL